MLTILGTYYRDRRAGTFQEYVVCPQHSVLPLPSNITYETGACLGVAALTAAMTLWKWLGVPMPPTGQLEIPVQRGYILIWGGSTITGQFAIQFAIHSGFDVITVTSAKTKQLAEQLGAKHVIVRDGKSNTEILAKVQAITGDDMTNTIDIVGKETAPFCLKALSTTKPAALAPLNFMKDDELIPANVTIANVEMKRFIIEDGNKVYAEAINRLILAGKIVFPAVEVLRGGLEQVEEGLAKLKRGDMGGKKLIVAI
jgi:NADPH:quinone reductase-like Zn-dependent oxidoreductase